MGVNIECWKTDWVLKRNFDRDAAFKVVRTMDDKWPWGNPEYPEEWDEARREILDSKNIEEALNAWGFRVDSKPTYYDGPRVFPELDGLSNKEEYAEVLELIAPFTRKDSYMLFHNEMGGTFAWYVSDGKFDTAWLALKSSDHNFNRIIDGWHY